MTNPVEATNHALKGAAYAALERDQGGMQVVIRQAR